MQGSRRNGLAPFFCCFNRQEDFVQETFPEKQKVFPKEKTEKNGGRRL